MYLEDDVIIRKKFWMNLKEKINGCDSMMGSLAMLL